MSWLTPPVAGWKKLLIVVAMLALALLLGRDLIVEALVGRADAMVRAGDSATAIALLHRAFLFDRTEPNAAQRFGLIAQFSHKPALLKEAVIYEGPAMLRRHTLELATTYAADLSLLGDYHGAEKIWGTIADASDPTALESDLYILYAAEMARKAGDCVNARHYYAQHLRLNPRDKHAISITGELQKRCST